MKNKWSFTKLIGGGAKNRSPGQTRRGACQIHNFSHIPEDRSNACIFHAQKRSQLVLTT